MTFGAKKHDKLDNWNPIVNQYTKSSNFTSLIGLAVLEIQPTIRSLEKPNIFVYNRQRWSRDAIWSLNLPNQIHYPAEENILEEQIAKPAFVVGFVFFRYHRVFCSTASGGQHEAAVQSSPFLIHFNFKFVIWRLGDSHAKCPGCPRWDGVAV